jgi:hypothetical protein
MIVTMVYDETDVYMGTYHNGYRSDYLSRPQGAVDGVCELIVDFAWVADNGGLPANLGDIPTEARLGD